MMEVRNGKWEMMRGVGGQQLISDAGTGLAVGATVIPSGTSPSADAPRRKWCEHWLTYVYLERCTHKLVVVNAVADGLCFGC